MRSPHRDHGGPLRHLSRRHLLTAAGATGAGLATAGVLPALPAQAAPGDGGTAGSTTLWTARTTQNRWPVADPRAVEIFLVEGSDATAALLATAGQPGDVATVLLHVARRFHYEIAALGRGDIRGYTTDRTVTAAYESNHLSGTAIAIRPDRYPPGSTGNLFATEITILRDVLAECDGVVRWGGDDPTRPSEGHFQIDVPPDNPQLARIAATIRGWRTRPGQGAGTPPEASTPDRRRAAQTLQRRQH